MESSVPWVASPQRRIDTIRPPQKPITKSRIRPHESPHAMAFYRNPDAPAAAAPVAPPEVQTPNPSIVPGDPPSPEMEATAEALTREEVIRRRRRRAARLAGVYRRLYWAIAEEVRARHRQYVWDLARSPLEAEQPPPPPGAPIPAVGEPQRSAPVPRRKKCGFTGCKVRAMATARFCHSHILSDPKQVLYKPCAYITKRFVTSRSLVSTLYLIWMKAWIFSWLGFLIRCHCWSGSSQLEHLQQARYYVS